jgi:hypothetical protein
MKKAAFYLGKGNVLIEMRPKSFVRDIYHTAVFKLLPEVGISKVKDILFPIPVDQEINLQAVRTEYIVLAPSVALISGEVKSANYRLAIFHNKGNK